MENENVYQQRTNAKGEVNFRTKFGRQKAIVFCKQGDFYYVDLYDNRPGKTDRIGLGLDELDTLIRMRPHIESLKQCFPAQTVVIPQVVKGAYQPEPSAAFKRPPTPTRPLTIERMPLQSTQPSQLNKRLASGDETEIKKPRIENVSPVTTILDENTVPSEITDFFYAPLFKDI